MAEKGWSRMDFVRDLSVIQYLTLTHLTCKGSAWDFADKCHSAFNTLKKAFTTALILVRG